MTLGIHWLGFMTSVEAYTL